MAVGPAQEKLFASKPSRAVGCGVAARRDVGPVERGLPQDPGPGRAQAGQRAARRAQQVGAPGGLLQRRRLPRARLGGAPADRRLGAAGGRDREDEDGAAARCASTSRCAARSARAPAPRSRAPATGNAQALARGGDAAQGRGQRPLPAGRVRRRPVAGAPRRGHGRVPRPGRVLPPHLPHREPQAPARRARVQRLAGDGRRPGGPAPDQLRRRQDPLDAGALSPVLRGAARASWPASTRC